MNRNLQKAFRVLLGLLLAAALFPPTRAKADVYFTGDGAGDADSIYVAGDPDYFPMEYYDASSGTYRGAAPNLLKLISSQTGLDFTYIRAGTEDRRKELFENRQVDMIFVCGDERLVMVEAREKVKWVAVEKDGEMTDIYCVFTDIAKEEDVDAIKSVIDSLSRDDVANLFVSSYVTFDQVHTQRIVRPFTIALIAAAASICLLLFVMVRHKKKTDAHRYTDPVTNIGNKDYFALHYDNFINDYVREYYYIVYYSFDIERVNKFFGNKEADRVLLYAASTISQHMRDNDFCARLTGGSFGAAFHCGNREQAIDCVSDTLRSLNAYGDQYHRSANEVEFRAGIYALGAADRNCEQALYNASQAYAFALERKEALIMANHDILDRQTEKISIREQLRDALEQREFIPYVQLIMNPSNSAVSGGEVISRWDNKRYGLLYPENYMPDIWEMGLMGQFDVQMLEETCKLLEHWNLEGRNDFLICNLSRVTVSSPGHYRAILDVIQKYGFSRERLVLGITRDSLEENKDAALENMFRLKAGGVRIALNDFNNGYTSLTNLREYPVDILKIDKRLILMAEKDAQAAKLLHKIIMLAHALSIQVLVGGIETEKQDAAARGGECDFLQGFYYLKPMPVDEIELLLNERKPARTPDRVTRPNAWAGCADETPIAVSHVAAAPHTGAAPDFALAGDMITQGRKDEGGGENGDAALDNRGCSVAEAAQETRDFQSVTPPEKAAVEAVEEKVETGKEAGKQATAGVAAFDRHRLMIPARAAALGAAACFALTLFCGPASRHTHYTKH